MSSHPSTTSPRTDSTGAGAAPLLTALRVTALLSVLVVAAQFVTAGRLVSGEDAIGIHGAGAIVLHVVTGLAAAAAVLLWRRGGAPAWVAVLAAVVFVATFVQAATGDRAPLTVHVPGAMLVTVGVVWVLAWSLRSRAAFSR